MRRSLLNSGRSLTSSRCLSAQAATAAEVPNDPDILSTQPTELNQTTPTPPSEHTSIDGTNSSSPINLTRKYPRLQYRPPQLNVSPAYDLALEIINQDKLSTKRKITNTKAKIHYTRQKPETSLRGSQLRDLQAYVKHLEVLVDINEPEIRWRHAHGDTDLSMPIYRHLDQRKWSEKSLHLLMQRVTQMSVTPDVIPIISPMVDVRLSFPGRRKGERKGQFEVGEMLTSRDSEYLPKIQIQAFEGESKTYTIAIVDPDVPNESTDSFTTYLHYLQKDVSMDAIIPEVSSDNGQVTHTYIPPHPHEGTKYHRYTVLVWEQPKTSPQPNAPLSGSHDFPRLGFNPQHYAQQNGLHAVGISFWRQVWDADVVKVMKGYPDAKYADSTQYRKIKA